MAKTGITEKQVMDTIKTLVAQKQKPSIEKIRKLIGGSPNTILLYLNQWRAGQPLIEEIVSKELTPAIISYIEGFEPVLVAALQQNGEDIRSEIDADLLNAQAEIAKLAKLSSEWQSLNDVLAAQNKQFVQENHDLNITSNQRINDLVALKQDHKVAVDALQNKLMTAQSKCESAMLETGILRCSVQKFEVNEKEFKKKKVACESTIDKLQGQLVEQKSEHTQTVSDLQKRNDQKITDLQTATDEKVGDLHMANNKTLNDLQSQLRDLQNKLTQQEHLTSLESQNVSAKIELLDQAQKRIKDLHKQLEDNKNSLFVERKSLSDERNKREELVGKVSGLENKLGMDQFKYESELKDKQGVIDHLESSLSAKDAELVSLKSSLEIKNK